MCDDQKGKEMIWQDILLMIGGVGFFIGLTPSLFGKRKPEITSSLITGSILLTYCFVYFTLGLWLAFVSTLATSTAWFILAIQVIKEKKDGNRQRPQSKTGKP